MSKSKRQRQQIFSASPFEARFGFCRGLRTGNRIEIAGTAPIGKDGRTVGVGDPSAQAQRCFEIIEQTLIDLGGTLADVTRTRMFLTHIEHWPEIGGVHGKFFGTVQPVSTMVGVAALIDTDWLVEIEASAVVRDVP